MLTALGEAPDAASGYGPLLAPVAASRVLTLYDEVGATARRRIIDRLAPATLARDPDLPWLARVELVRLATHAAREAGDAAALARVARTSGCVTIAADLGLIGPLASADLTAPAPASSRAPRSGRAVTASGCRVDLPSTADGRGGARLVRMAFEGAAGSYDVVLDYAGEGRVSLDGGPLRDHGSAKRYGPRISVAHATLTAGRHEIELRIATRAGVAGFALYVFGLDRGAAGQAGPEIRFVDPRDSSAGTRPAVKPYADAAGHVATGGPLADYCRAAIAQRIEATDSALGMIDRLRAQPRFALGLALAASIAHDDPTRPASIARDAARSALRAAVAVDPDLARAWHDLAALALEDERPRDAIEAGREAARAAPGWWAPQLLLARAFTARGLDFDANRAVDAAAREAGPARARLDAVPCPVIEALRRRAQDRRALSEEARLEAALVAAAATSRRASTACGRAAIWRARRRCCARRCGWSRSATISWAIWRCCCRPTGRHDAALAEMARLVARDPNDPQRRLRLADAQAAAGQANGRARDHHRVAGGTAGGPRGAARGPRAGRAVAARRISRRGAGDHPRLRGGRRRATPRRR